MPPERILVVDDDPAVLSMVAESLQARGFEVAVASGVRDALCQISQGSFDGLLTDLQMPYPGDGFAVVTAMKRLFPAAVTLVYSGYPDVEGALSFIRMQADEVLLKPVSIAMIADVFRARAAVRPPVDRAKEGVATILRRDGDATIAYWLILLDRDPEMSMPLLDGKARSGHLPKLLEEIIMRLEAGDAYITAGPRSKAAVEHGRLRNQQQYSPEMLVEESRLWQVSIFQTLQNNLAVVDFSRVLKDVIIIADEVDSQLAQAMRSFSECEKSNGISSKM